MSAPQCFTCTIRPAGNGHAGSFSAYCDTCQPRDQAPLPTGTSAGRCAACGDIFTSTSAFDKHQTIGGDGAAICHDPAARGLVAAMRREWKLWGWPDSGQTERPGRQPDALAQRI